MLLCDLFCSAGVIADGYADAGFDIIGVDIEPQPNYPYKFIQTDAMDFLATNWKRFDAFHASPICQRHTRLKRTKTWDNEKYLDFIAPIRNMLNATGKPWIMENVKDSPLQNPIELCGWQFGLKTYRHRLFESNIELKTIPHIKHPEPCPPAGRGASPIYGFIVVGGNGGAKYLPEGWKHLDYLHYAMGAKHRVTRTEISQGVPPAMGYFLGKQLFEYARNHDRPA